MLRMEILSLIYQSISLQLSKAGINFLDFVIILVFIFYAIEGYAVGFLSSFFDFVSFIFSFVFALKFYSFIGVLIVKTFSIPQSFANAIGFFVIAFLSEIILSIILKTIFAKPPKEKTNQKINHILGFVPGLFSAAVLISFLLTLIISLPFSPTLKKEVSNSKLGSVLVSQTSGLEKKLNNIFGRAVNDTLNFLTVEPKSDEFVKLNFKTKNISTNSEAELKMLEMVNKERTSRGLQALIMDGPLREVARLHSKDMFEQGYFSHYAPSGLSPFDRMQKDNISFNYAGENLALAPSVDFAMQGLMNSPGHKANILSPNFKKVGIGAIDGGIYGIMFSQEFTD